MTERKKQYLAHIDSSYWREVRKRVLERDGKRCRVCNSAKDLCAHHRTYQNFGKEMDNLGDITCLCRACHELFHREEKKTRKRQRKKRLPKHQVTGLALACFDDSLDQKL